jgi:PTS system nitrogen regulatory IIA component
MNIESILVPQRTRCGLDAASKKKAIEQISIFMQEQSPEIDQEELYQNLIERERLGTTALGHGIAIPHCRLASCNEIVCALIQLKKGVDFGAFDGKPVQILFLLIVPANVVDEHLQALSMLATRLESEIYRESLMAARNDQTLYQAACSDPAGSN